MAFNDEVFNDIFFITIGGMILGVITMSIKLCYKSRFDNVVCGCISCSREPVDDDVETSTTTTFSPATTPAITPAPTSAPTPMHEPPSPPPTHSIFSQFIPRSHIKKNMTLSSVTIPPHRDVEVAVGGGGVSGETLI